MKFQELGFQRVGYDRPQELHGNLFRLCAVARTARLLEGDDALAAWTMAQCGEGRELHQLLEATWALNRRLGASIQEQGFKA